MPSRPGGNWPQCDDRRLFVMLPPVDAGGTNPQDADETFVEELIEAVARADDASGAGWRLRAVALHQDGSGRRWLEASQKPPKSHSSEATQQSDSSGSAAPASRKAA